LEFNVPFQHKYGYIRDESKKVSSLLFQCDMRTLLQDTYKYKIQYK